MSLRSRDQKPHYWIVVLGALALCLAGCKKPVQVGPNTPMAQGGASVTVDSYGLVRPTLETSTGAVSLREPVFQVTLTVSATGDQPVHWDPGFGSGTATQTRNVLLFAAPSWESGLSSSNNVSIIATEKYAYLDDPVRKPVDIAPGKSITDILLFSAPPSSAKNLILSIPPRVYGDEVKFPGYISLPYKATEAEAPNAVGIGEAYKAEGYTFTVTDASIVHQALKTVDGKVAVSRAPLLRISFTVKNTGKSPMAYIPTMLSGGVDFPVLIDEKGSIQSRATFAPNVDVVGQISKRTSIAPGESLEDFILFDRPTRGVKTLRFQYPGRRVGRHDLIKVEFPYEWSNPPVPEKFQPKDDE